MIIHFIELIYCCLIHVSKSSFTKLTLFKFFIINFNTKTIIVVIKIVLLIFDFNERHGKKMFSSLTNKELDNYDVAEVISKNEFCTYFNT